MQNKNIANTYTIEEDEIDLKELFTTIWKNKGKILLFTFIITFLTIIYTLTMPNEYTSTTVLEPQGQSKSMDLGGLSSLASLAGVNIGSEKMTPYDSLNIILKNYTFQKMVVNKYNLTQLLSTQNMKKNFVFAFGYNGFYNLFHSKNKANKADKPSLEFNTVKKLEKIISLNSDKKSGALTMSVKLPDRFLAKKLLNIYLTEATNYLRTIDMKNIKEKINYYANELSTANSIQLKTQISQYMAALMQKEVFANANPYYIVKQITKPEVAYIKDKSGPKRALVVIVAFITSIILAIFGVFFIEFLKNSRAENQDKN
jgi:uncharacterized protein involved in exopolysaccharide biosynthesis